VLAHSSTVAMLLGLSSIDSSAPSPDPSQEKRRFAPRAPSQQPSSLHDTDQLGGARGDPQHPAAESAPSQHAPVTAVTGASFKHRQGPRADELLAALALVAPAYKMPRRSNAETHLTPSYLPDMLA
jgi:hypothetical protein